MVYLLQMVIFHGELLNNQMVCWKKAIRCVYSGHPAMLHLRTRIFESLRLEKDGNSTGTTPFSRIWMVKPWWNREDVSNPLTNGMVIPMFFSRDWRCLEFFAIGAVSVAFSIEKIASILGTIMDLGIWEWIRAGMGYIWRIQSQWNVIYKWLTIPFPQLWQE